ncbi:sensor histidine kinase [Ekhidna sp.]
MQSISGFAQNQSFDYNGKVIPLRGDWSLVMGSFLSYKEVLEDSSATQIQVPGTWNDVKWNEVSIGPYGYGTYYTTVILDKTIKNQTLALDVSEISLAYQLYINDQFIGQVGTPGTSKENTDPKIDAEVFEFNASPGDTLALIFHISNFSHESGGLWYEPKIGPSDKVLRKHDLNKFITLIMIGCILIGGVFQLYIFLRKQTEKSGLYFSLVCLTIIMLMISRGSMPIMDLFPNTSWVVLKKIVYLAVFLIGPSNALFLREIFPRYFNKYIINSMAIIGLVLFCFTLLVSPRISYALVPYHHVYNILIGIYLFIVLIKTAIDNKFGARFLLIGYLSGFFAVLHDILSSQYIIPGYSFSMIHVGILLYMLQLMALLGGRYLFALEGKEQLSNHLKKVNKELEEIVARRTKALKDKSDIIELKNAELEKAIKEKDHLMAVVAHDLKAPLSSIQGISDLMKSDLKGQTAEFNEMIKKVSIDGREMIDNLTELKTYEQSDFKVTKTVFKLPDFFEQKKITYELIAENKEINLRSKLSSRRKKILSDSNMLGRIADNLLSNALKFTQKGCIVNFLISVKKGNLILIVSDNGPGFSEKDKDSIFKEFQKLSARPTAGESSAGLGLSIVKTLVDKLEGSIELESEKGDGAKFTVTIPLN